jgi:hypothetical protein
LKAGLFLTQRIAECIGYRVSDLLEYSDMKEDFIKNIGRASVEILNEIKDLHIHDFGIYIELAADEEEKGVLENNIQASLSAQKIDIDDAIDIRGVKNVKIASQLLKVRKRRKDKLDQKRQESNIQAQSQANQQASAVAEQGKQQTISAKGQVEGSLLEMKSQLEMQRMQQEFELKARLIQLQKSIEGDMKSSDIQSMLDREKYKEDRKDDRTAKQASQQSKLIQQRQQDLDPIDFNGEDSLGSGLGSLIDL